MWRSGCVWPGFFFEAVLTCLAHGTGFWRRKSARTGAAIHDLALVDASGLVLALDLLHLDSIVDLLSNERAGVLEAGLRDGHIEKIWPTSLNYCAAVGAHGAQGGGAAAKAEDDGRAGATLAADLLKVVPDVGAHALGVIFYVEAFVTRKADKVALGIVGGEVEDGVEPWMFGANVGLVVNRVLSTPRVAVRIGHASDHESGAQDRLARVVEVRPVVPKGGLAVILTTRNT